MHSKISKIEIMITKANETINKLLDIENEQSYFLNNGLNGIKNRLLTDSKIRPNSQNKGQFQPKFRNDKSLRYPHQKILEYLSNQYDYRQDKFLKVHFSKLVKECKIGKNKANEYLDLLVDKGYVKRQSDGYRVWYWVVNF